MRKLGRQLVHNRKCNILLHCLLPASCRPSSRILCSTDNCQQWFLTQGEHSVESKLAGSQLHKHNANSSSHTYFLQHSGLREVIMAGESLPLHNIISQSDQSSQHTVTKKTHPQTVHLAELKSYMTSEVCPGYVQPICYMASYTNVKIFVCDCSKFYLTCSCLASAAIALLSGASEGGGACCCAMAPAIIATWTHTYQ